MYTVDQSTVSLIGVLVNYYVIKYNIATLINSYIIILIKKKQTEWLRLITYSLVSVIKCSTYYITYCDKTVIVINYKYIINFMISGILIKSMVKYCHLVIWKVVQCAYIYILTKELIGKCNSK